MKTILLRKALIFLTLSVSVLLSISTVMAATLESASARESL